MRAEGMAKIAGWTLIALTAAGLAWGAHAVLGTMEQGELISYLPRLASGLGITLALSVSSFAIGGLLAFGLLLAWETVPRSRTPIRLYQNAVRQTPLLAQLYLVYFGAGEMSGLLESLGLWWLFRDAVFCAVLVFVINTTAYQSFILIGCVENVGKGQREGGLALGLPPVALVTRVLLPQAFASAVKPLGNEFVGMIKASSVASVITVFDLLGETQAIYSETFNIGYFLIAAAIYVVLVEMTRVGFDGLLRLTRRDLAQRPGTKA